MPGAAARRYGGRVTHRRFHLLFAAACAASLVAACSNDGAPPAPPAYSSPVYADDDKWLCRPGLAKSPCEGDLDATLVAADGSRMLEPWLAAENPAVDCFYLYPTINFGPEPNAPFDGNYAAETEILRLQAVRFGSACRVVAPLYRQFQFGGQPEPGVNPADVAYADVLDAFRHYLANDNGGRGIVLFGHSQGAGLVNRLVREEIDGNPGLREQLVSALVIGATVTVPEGADVGGDFHNVPACRDSAQTGCVVSYAAFAADSPPPPTAFFGRPRSGGGRALCTNPAALASGERTALQPYWQGTFENVYAPGVEAPPIATPFVGLPGLTSGRCVESGDFTWLEITVNADPSDPRGDEIGGQISPEWGLHAIDFQVALGDLVALVDAQARSWTEAHGRR